MTQILEDSSDDDDNNKPHFPCVNILGELQTNNELQPLS